MKHFGFDRSIAEFVKHLPLKLAHNRAIIDVGCGSGSLGLTLFERLQASKITFTDIHNKPLLRVLAAAQERGIDTTHLRIGIADISTPKLVHWHDKKIILAEHSFSVVALGAVLGYAKDQAQSLQELLSLVEPNGYLVNIEMNEGIIGRFISWWYRYPLLPTSRIIELMQAQGFRVEKHKITIFPARLTRICYVAQRV